MGNKINFTYLFYKHILFRHSCGVCHFTNLKRPSDITLADYWGWERTNPDFNVDNKGCSLVLCNTDKGRKLFEAVQDKLNTIPAEIPNIMQVHLSKPSDIHPQRMLFEKYYSTGGLEYAIDKLGLAGWHYRIFMFKSVVKSIVMRYIRKILQVSSKK